MKTTIGLVLFNDALPKPMRDYSRQIDGRNISPILTDLAKNYPGAYAHSVHTIKKLGDTTSFESGHTVTLKDLEPPPDKKEILRNVRSKISAILKNSKKGEEENNFVKILTNAQETMTKSVMESGIKKGSGLIEMVVTKSRGNPVQANSIVGSPMIFTDFENKPIPVPIENSYADGMDSGEYWAASYGTRRGVLASKIATQAGGAFGKKLTSPMTGVIITEKDCGTTNGIMKSIDQDSIQNLLGAYLARQEGQFGRNIKITASVLSNLRKRNIIKIMVRSPMTCESDDGVCAMCRGEIETMKLPEIGRNIGVTSSTTIAEPVAQGALNVKHVASSGAQRSKQADLSTLSLMTDVPKRFVGSSVLAEKEGTITSIVIAPQGGHYIYIDEGEEHYAPKDAEVLVKKNQKVYKGQKLCSGLTNPKELVRLRGVGEGRKYWASKFKELMQDAYGANINDRHFETVARGILNNAEVYGDKINLDEHLPGDIVSYSSLSKSWKPKSQLIDLINAIGKYLTKPVLHHMVGTKIDSKVIEDFKEAKISKIDVTDEEPPFQPIMRRVDDVAMHDPDWLARLGSKHLKEGISEAVSRGERSNIHGTNFIPGVVFAEEFGETGKRGEY